MRDRNIGKVISVDNFRLIVKLDDDLKSLHKSGYEDIYEVARINSYIIIPIGAEKVVAIVTSIRAVDETEFGKNKEAIFLTKSARYIVATMIGTIENKGTYIQGVYNFPILDNPVWYVTRQDLDNIFDQNEKAEINLEEDYYLPIGTSPAFPDYKIKINPDKLFGKHAAILGNTGSGKSCTFVSIIQSMFDFKYNGKKIQNAHIVIFDTNGEYKQAFQGTKEKPYKDLKLVNPFCIDKNGIRVPFWFMNLSDFDFLFEPTSGTQVPVFKRALGLAKNQTTATEQNLLPRAVLSKLESICNECDENNFKIKNTIYHDLEVLSEELSELSSEFDISKIQEALAGLLNEKNGLVKSGQYVNGTVKTKALVENSTIIREQLSLYSNSIRSAEISVERNIDLPVWFNFEDLVTRFFDDAIDEQEKSGNRLREFVSTLRLRLESYLNDERISTPLMLSQKDEIDNALALFLAFILGDFCKVFQSGNGDLFSEYYANQQKLDGNDEASLGQPNQITIIDMSLLPYEVLETVTGLIGRLILEFVSRFSEGDRGKMPIVLALEEAQNYIPEKSRNDRESIAKRVFERIAREGRKYGISLLVTSQRPSELSKTVLSQCNSFIVHRLQNPEDQKYIRQLVSAANEDILLQLPVLPQQHAIIMGDAVRTPVQAKLNSASPRPNSNNPQFVKNWINLVSNEFPNYHGIAAAWERGEKYNGEEHQEVGSRVEVEKVEED